MRLLKGNILAKPYYLNQYENNILIVGKKRSSERVSEVVSGMDAKSVMHKRLAYNEFESDKKTYRVIHKKNVLLTGNIEFNEKDVYVRNKDQFEVAEDFIAVEPVGMKRKVHVVQGKNPTPYQSTRVIAVKDNEKAGIVAGDELIVRPVALVVNLNLMGNGTPTWFYIGNKIHVVLSVGDIIAKVVDGNIVPLKDYLIVKLNYEMTPEYKAMRRAGLDIPESNNVKTAYANVVAGGEKIGVEEGDCIVFENNLVVKIDSDIVNSTDKQEVLYRVSKRNILASVEY